MEKRVNSSYLYSNAVGTGEGGGSIAKKKKTELSSLESAASGEQPHEESRDQRVSAMEAAAASVMTSKDVDWPSHTIISQACEAGNTPADHDHAHHEVGLSSTYVQLRRRSNYRDRTFRGTGMEYEHALQTSRTVYVGNLSFYTTEEQIWELFCQASHGSKPRSVKRIVMGLNRETKTPCGFCFVEFHTRKAAEQAVAWVSGRILDDRAIRVDIDWGFQDGRQYGRGKSGGQVRDEYRMDYDEGRGGYGGLGEAKAAKDAEEEQRAKRRRTEEAGKGEED